MQRDNIDAVLEFLEKHKIKTLDLTGGAPEMNPHFRDLVIAARAMDVQVIDRCNLTILEEEDFSWLADFLAEYSVEVVASMPCYLEENVDRQRGKGVVGDFTPDRLLELAREEHEKSIAAGFGKLS